MRPNKIYIFKEDYSLKWYVSQKFHVKFQFFTLIFKYTKRISIFKQANQVIYTKKNPKVWVWKPKGFGFQNGILQISCK